MKWVIGKQKCLVSALEINQAVCGDAWDSGTNKLTLADSLKSNQIRPNSGYVISANRCWEQDV